VEARRGAHRGAVGKLFRPGVSGFCLYGLSPLLAHAAGDDNLLQIDNARLVGGELWLEELGG
jgi:hypothetical protein